MIVVEARHLTEIRAAVRKLGDGNTIPREIGREIRPEVPPLRELVKEAALEMLPKGGGLNEWVASSKVNASIRYGHRSAGVFLRMGRNSRGGRSDLKGIDGGIVRHPTFGRRGGHKVRWRTGRGFVIEKSQNDWHDEPVRPGYFTATLRYHGTARFTAASERAVRAAIVKLGLG